MSQHFCPRLQFSCYRRTNIIYQKVKIEDLAWWFQITRNKSTYRYDISYVLGIVQCLKSNSNHFVVLKCRATTVTTIYCCINLLNVKEINTLHNHFSHSTRDVLETYENLMSIFWFCYDFQEIQDSRSWYNHSMGLQWYKEIQFSSMSFGQVVARIY